MQRPGPVDEAQPERRSKVKYTLSLDTFQERLGCFGHNLTMWYMDMLSHPLTYRVAMRQDAVTRSFPPLSTVHLNAFN